MIFFIWTQIVDIGGKKMEINNYSHKEKKVLKCFNNAHSKKCEAGLDLVAACNKPISLDLPQ